MTAPRILAGLSEIADRYDILLCDVWAALARFHAERGPVILISNSPRPSEVVKSQLTELAVPAEACSAFFTSGDATRKLLAERAPGPAWRIGPERDNVLYAGLGLEFSG